MMPITRSEFIAASGSAALLAAPGHEGKEMKVHGEGATEGKRTPS